LEVFIYLQFDHYAFLLLLIAGEIQNCPASFHERNSRKFMKRCTIYRSTSMQPTTENNYKTIINEHTWWHISQVISPFSLHQCWTHFLWAYWMREIEAVNTYIKKCISKTNINLKAARIRWHLKRDEMENRSSLSCH